jgi:hypothetical protein
MSTSLEQALAIGRERQLQLWEGRARAVMAAAHLGLGDRARALTLADEAICFTRRLGSRMWEFSALLTRIRALRETQGVQATREIEAALAEADAWLEMSGAKSYEPFLHVERAELARLNGDEPPANESFAKRTGCSSKSAPRSAPSRWHRNSAHELPHLSGCAARRRRVLWPLWRRTPIRADVRTLWEVQLPRDALLPRLRSRAVASRARRRPARTHRSIWPRRSSAHAAPSKVSAST